MDSAVDLATQVAAAEPYKATVTTLAMTPLEEERSDRGYL